jgi:hypothetical protein
VVRGHEQAALPDPAKTGYVCRKFLGEDPADVLVARSLRGRDGERPIALPLENICNPQRNLIEGDVDNIVRSMTVQDCALFVFLRQEITTLSCIPVPRMQSQRHAIKAEREKIPPGKPVKKICRQQADGRAGDGDPVRVSGGADPAREDPDAQELRTRT